LLLDTFKGIKDPVRKLLLSDFIPQMLLGVELGRASRKREQPNILRDYQVLPSVGACSINYHYDEVMRVTLTNLFEEFAHALSIHLRADLPIKVSFTRAHGSVGVHKLSLVSV
jgi:hypothetical protein